MRGREKRSRSWESSRRNKMAFKSLPPPPTPLRQQFLKLVVVRCPVYIHIHVCVCSQRLSMVKNNSDMWLYRVGTISWTRAWSRFLRRLRSDLTRSLLYLNIALSATWNVLRTGFWPGKKMCRPRWLYVEDNRENFFQAIIHIHM